MKTSLKYLSLILSLSLLASCNGVGFKLNCDPDEVALQEAARENNTEEMRRLLAKRNIDIDAHCKEHDPPLSEAAREGHLEAVSLLVNKGANSNVTDRFGGTPLIWAHLSKKNDHRDVGEFIRKMGGGDVRVLIKKKRSELEEIRCKHENAPRDKFLQAIAEGQTRIMAEMLDDGGVNINIKDDNGDTALIIAARSGHLHIVEELIQRGANKNRQNNDRQTALEAAIRNRRRTITLELIKNNNSLNAKNEKGQTALMVAIETGQEEIAGALIEAGANLNLKDNKDWPALKYARKGKHKTIEKELLRNGAEEYLLSKQIKKSAKSIFFKAAEKAPEAGAAALL